MQRSNPNYYLREPKTKEELYENIDNAYQTGNFDLACAFACRTNDLTLVNRIIDSGAKNYDWYLKCASRNGQLEIAERMVELGANVEIGLVNACFYIKPVIIDRMIDLGAKDFENALEALCVSNTDLNLFDKFVKLGAKDFNKGLVAAYDNKNQIAIDEMLRLGATNLEEVKEEYSKYEDY